MGTAACPVEPLHNTYRQPVTRNIQTKQRGLCNHNNRYPAHGPKFLPSPVASLSRVQVGRYATAVSSLITFSVTNLGAQLPDKCAPQQARSERCSTTCTQTLLLSCKFHTAMQHTCPQISDNPPHNMTPPLFPLHSPKFLIQYQHRIF
jgi:hypothetical protein